MINTISKTVLKILASTESRKYAKYNSVTKIIKMFDELLVFFILFTNWQVVIMCIEERRWASLFRSKSFAFTSGWRFRLVLSFFTFSMIVSAVSIIPSISANFANLFPPLSFFLYLLYQIYLHK